MVLKTTLSNSRQISNLFEIKDLYIDSHLQLLYNYLMTEQHTELIKRAEAKHSKIYPAAKKWEDCFTEEDGLLMFWYNDRERSTHIEIQNT